MDDASFGSSKPGKRGRGAGGKATVMVAVEIEGSKPRFATMLQVKRHSATEIHATFTDHLQEDWVMRAAG
jgi:hypothetical protein